MTTSIIDKEARRREAFRNTARCVKARLLELSLRADDVKMRHTHADDMMVLFFNVCGVKGEVLRRHYIDGEKFSDIAEELHYSERQIMRIASQARDEVIRDCELVSINGTDVFVPRGDMLSLTPFERETMRFARGC